ncbi:hypothetical protein [Pseudoxanthomonas sp. PXM02]|uniref:hypothetical protein n=1 Tax=Pseudoxanthomonas sp. PXM02 TaxID=2769294 RepID=UPI001780FED5|nr:hypothetical protein [Pseudoxanthomonas sp. PXM02]MBD9480112.1 hypothetical protein [Pseudoxanthomonas sp. PXM02]
MPLRLMMLCLALFSSGAFAKDKTGPGFLRERHAGIQATVSSRPVAELFPELLSAIEACYVGTTDPSKVGVYGVVGSMTAASRTVHGERSEDGRSAYIQVRARSAFGWIESAFLQVDLDSIELGTRVTAYHERNVELQRSFLTHVNDWVAGNSKSCPPDPFMRKPVVETP